MRVTRGMMRRRLVMLLMALFAAILALVGRLFFVQVLQSGWLSGLAKSSWDRTVPLA
ncbi:hypothetical protein GCM10025858_32810 [Alicyclobacillus sacchari]|uniref:hypothetical protein n=1 Tax=Alicyclobacillus sacchari TaxID=392010 RepID=UPI0023E93F49|nr:hypothetical protein GCM10025858_32810 [Alicyclobacillus sacchari]